MDVNQRRVTERLRAADVFGGRLFPAISDMANAFEFIQQVRAEAARVVWPTRRETLITTGLVILLAVAASVFLLVVDEVLRILVGYVLGFGRHG
jgi:preprotein translocase subunit SecE